MSSYTYILIDSLSNLVLSYKSQVVLWIHHPPALEQQVSHIDCMYMYLGVGTCIYTADTIVCIQSQFNRWSGVCNNTGAGYDWSMFNLLWRVGTIIHKCSKLSELSKYNRVCIIHYNIYILVKSMCWISKATPLIRNTLKVSCVCVCLHVCTNQHCIQTWYGYRAYAIYSVDLSML